MAIDKLTPRYLNLDDDERLVQAVQMTDALNVDISVDDEEDAGVIKQAQGNRQGRARNVSDNLPSGVNHVISSINYDAGGVVFYYVWNSDNDHGVYMYDTAQHDFVKLYESSALAFEKNSHIQSEVVKMGNGDLLLYFTDGNTEPKKINVSRLLSASYDASIDTSTVALNAITVCKRPPMRPPTFTFVQAGEAETVVNRIVDNVFQFAAQYVYVDGEVSAIGPYSKLSYYEDHFNPTGTMTDLYLTQFDAIEVSVEKAGLNDDTGANVDGDVKAVRFLARNGNTGAWHVFGERNTSYNSTVAQDTFTNSKAYRIIGDAETNKLFDNVPYKATSLCVAENRLFFGNYVDGYDATTWPNVIKKNAGLSTHSFPVETGIEELAVNLGGDDFPANYLNEIEHAYRSLETHRQQYEPFVAMEPRSENSLAQDPNLGTADSLGGYFVQAKGSNSPDDSGEFFGGDTTKVPWAISSSGDTGEAGPIEPNMAWGMGNSNRIEVVLDMDQIPVDGYGVSGQVGLTWAVEGSRAMIIPNYRNQTGKIEYDRRFKPFPEGTETGSDNSVQTEKFKLFHGGDSIASADDLNLDENVYGYFKVCGIAGINWGSGTDQSVTIDTQAAMTRTEIAQALADKIMEQQVGFAVGGNAFATAHGNHYRRNVALFATIDRNDQSKMCRYLLTNNGNNNGQAMNFRATTAFVVGAGGTSVQLHVQYQLDSLNMTFNRVAHAGPAIRVTGAGGVGGLQQQLQPQGLDTTTPLEDGNIVLEMTRTGNGIDGAEGGGGAEDLYHSAILDWNSSEKEGNISFTTSVSSAGDIGVNRLTFRSGAHHPLGVVFYDHRNRSSNVNLLPESYVPFSGSADSPVGNGSDVLVPYDIDVNFRKEFIPDWAERYQIVYAGNSLFSDSLTVTVGEALVADMSKVVIRDPSFSDGDDVDADSLEEGVTDETNFGNFPSMAVAESVGIINNAIYLPMRFFEGKVDSYKESKSARLNYEFRPGDKLRIISYAAAGQDDVLSNAFPKNYFFDVLGYKYFEANSDQNVLVLPNQEDGNFTAEGEYRRSGWMLILRGDNVQYPGFRPDDVRNQNSTVNRWGQDVRVEILRPRVDVVDEDRVYYEIGESFPVGKDSKQPNSYNNEFPVVFSPGSESNGTYRVKTIQRLFRGDEFYAIKLATEADVAADNGDNPLNYFFGFNDPPTGLGGDPLNANDDAESNVYTVGRVLGRFYDQSLDYEYYEYEVFESKPYTGSGSLGPSPDPFQIFTEPFAANPEGFPISSTAAMCEFVMNNRFVNVHLTDQGDTYFRQRDMRTSAVIGGSYDPGQLTNATDANFIRRNIEDPGFNDFLPSTVTRNYHFGRPHIFSPEEQTSVRSSSVTYSDPYASDGEVLALSSFNPSMFPFKDYNLRYGGIQRMFDMGGGIAMLHERKVSSTPVSKDYLSTADGGMMIASNKVLGTERYYAGEHGIGKYSKGAVSHGGAIFFVDVEMGTVCMLGGNGIQVISDRKVDSYFKDRLERVQGAMMYAATLIGVHPDNKEIIVAVNSRARRDIRVDGIAYGRNLPVDGDDNTKFDLTMMQKVYKIAGSPLDIVNERQNWEDVFMDWGEAGKGVVLVDQPRELGYVDAGLSGKVTHDFLVTDKDSNFAAKMTQGIRSRLGTLDETAGGARDSGGSGQASKGTVAGAERGSIGYNYESKVWTSKYSFEPEDIVSIFEDFLTFSSGSPWRHDDLGTVNNYYGVQYTSVVEAISKMNPSMVKLYKALSLEGNSVWSAELSNSDQSSTITVDMWKDQNIDGTLRAGDGFREGMLYCNMPGDTSTSSHLDEITIGEVTDVTTPGEIKFKGRVNNIPFNSGDRLFLADGTDTTRTITSVKDRNTLNVSANTGINVGDILVAQSRADASHIAGDRLRDYYLKIKLTNSSTTKDELYAINAIYERSRLHNDRVN
jgi:hypothetical protein